ncbi:MAG: Peroxiredoxin [Schlesneria sp.]|nr:Peroxiredoxin [Schlesneria sp.]
MRMLAACLFTGVAITLTAGSLPAAEKASPVLEHKVKTIKGEEVDLTKYQGKVLLVVNVASKCGATPQYEQLESLNDKYKDKGLAVLGFPCNQFGKQEPGTEEDIVKFCKSTYDVSFDMFAKIDVNGPDASPVYKTLTSKETDPKFAGDIKWNFEKFLIGRNGEIVARFPTGTKPDAPEVVKAIETELAKTAK